MRKFLTLAFAAALVMLGVTATAAAADEPTHQVAVYLYQKADPSAPPSWENSLTQHLVLVVDGDDWVTLTADMFPGLCAEKATAIAVQQDKVIHDGSFVFPETLTPPTGLAVHPYASRHDNLNDLVDLPACTQPTPTPTPTPVTPPAPEKAPPAHTQPFTQAPPVDALAHTGIDAVWGWVAAIGLIGLGLCFLTARRYNRQ